MRLRKVQYREYCFIKRNNAQHEGYFLNDSNNLIDGLNCSFVYSILAFSKSWSLLVYT